MHETLRLGRLKGMWVNFIYLFLFIGESQVFSLRLSFGEWGNWGIGGHRDQLRSGEGRKERRRRRRYEDAEVGEIGN